MKVELGTRTSRLATWQAEHVAARLREAHSDVEVELVGMSTLGDEVRDQSVPDLDEKGVFTRRLEEGLLAGEVDAAVHSLKDLPTDLPDGLVYAGSPTRGHPSDAFVSTTHDSLSELPESPVVATGSLRRRAQIREHRPDADFRDLRGNIGTRLDKLAASDWDGIVMAAVALDRLDRLDEASELLDPTDHVPAPAQGAIGLEIREDRDDVRQCLDAVVDTETVRACRAERHFMSELEGGCTVPLGAYGRRGDDEWTLYGWVGSEAEGCWMRERDSGDDPDAVADRMARKFVDAGAREVLHSDA